jgi:hypothetical protein
MNTNNNGNSVNHLNYTQNKRMSDFNMMVDPESSKGLYRETNMGESLTNEYDSNHESNQLLNDTNGSDGMIEPFNKPFKQGKSMNNTLQNNIQSNINTFKSQHINTSNHTNNVDSKLIKDSYKLRQSFDNQKNTI